MQEGYVGKTLRNEKDEEFIILNELSYKNIDCVYAMRVTKDNTEGEKLFFQLSSDANVSLVSINSKKMIKALSEELFHETKTDDNPRRIKPEESVADYLKYLDEFYKSKIVTSM